MKYFLTTTLKVVNNFSSNLAHSINNKCLTMGPKNCPLQLIYICTLPCKDRVKIGAKQFHVIVSKNSWIKTKTVFCLL